MAVAGRFSSGYRYVGRIVFMKKGYILLRLLRSVLSVLLIMFIVFILVYSMVPRDTIFFEDSTYRKLGGKPDEKTEYVYSTLSEADFQQTLNNYLAYLVKEGKIYES